MQRLQNLAQQLTKNNLGEEAPDVFKHVTLAPPDPILGTSLAFKADKDANKMNLGVGAYRDENLKPYPFKIVKKVQQEIVDDKTLDFEYLPIDGYAPFVDAARNLIIGKDSAVVRNKMVASTQAISGTGSLSLGFNFIKKYIPGEVYISNPTWGNHQTVINAAGLSFKYYTYFDAKTKGLNFEGMMSDLSKAPAGSIILLHACAHNPTGVDPSSAQWKQIGQLLKKNRLFPFVDCAYQGYVSGDLEKDNEAVRIFLDLGLQMIVSQSFAKNMGLYGERTGCLHFVCSSKDTAEKVLSQVKLVIRPAYSNPPKHGAYIASKILGNPKYYEEWRQEVYEVAQRIIKMRKLLRDHLVSMNTPGNWDHIVNQIGMFSYTGMSKEQCEILINKYHIYLLKNGRISMAGINTKNCEYLAKAMKDAIVSTK